MSPALPGRLERRRGFHEATGGCDPGCARSERAPARCASADARAPGARGLASLGAEGKGVPPLSVPGRLESCRRRVVSLRLAERLLLNLDAHGGRFSQRWQVYTEGWVALPGDPVGWPEGVLGDGRRRGA